MLETSGLFLVQSMKILPSAETSIGGYRANGLSFFSSLGSHQDSVNQSSQGIDSQKHPSVL